MNSNNIIIYTDPKIRLAKALEDPYTTPLKISAAMLAVEALGLKDRCLSPREATDEELGLAHDSTYVQEVWKAIPLTGAERFSEETYLNAYSAAALRLSAGGGLDGVDTLTKGQAHIVHTLGLPGHHATKDKAMGYCVFSNAAIAAKYAVSKGYRAIIIDVDQHEGNGTVNCIGDDKDIFFASIHLRIPPESDADRTFEYPYRPKGYQDKQSKRRIQIGLPPQTTANIFKAAYHYQVLAPAYAFIATSSKPTILIKSFGTDSTKGDPIGLFDISNQEFAAMIDQGIRAMGLPTLVMMEGGYKMENIAEVHARLLGRQAGIDPAIIEAAVEKSQSRARGFDEVLERRRAILDEIPNTNLSLKEIARNLSSLGR